MPTNDFLPFATGGSANVETQVNYAADSLRTNGNQPGVAVSAFNNKALRQACWIASVLAQFIANSSGSNVLDDANQTNLLNAMALTWPNNTLPTLTNLTSTSTTTGYVFYVTSANATVGATYTNNAHTFTVLSTISAGTVLYCSGALAPTSSGTLTKSGGTGDATITFSSAQAMATYTTPANAKYLKIRMIGAGGGGAGSGSGRGTGGAGLATIFGAAILFAGGGASGGTGVPAAAASGSVSSPAVGIALNGGQPTQYADSSGTIVSGAIGASSPFGAGGYGADQNPGGNAAVNTGAGGGGAGITSGSIVGNGGGAGAYVDALITNPAASYFYAVGTAGGAGSAGTGGSVGGTGGSGLIMIEEHYTA